MGVEGKREQENVCDLEAQWGLWVGKAPIKRTGTVEW